MKCCPTQSLKIFVPSSGFDILPLHSLVQFKLILLLDSYELLFFFSFHNKQLQRIERKVQESHKSMSTIMDTLHLIKNAHENNVKCDQLVGQHLIDCLAHGHLDDAHSESDKPDQDVS